MTWDDFVLHVKAAVGVGRLSYSLSEDVEGGGPNNPITSLGVFEAPTFTIQGNGYSIKNVYFDIPDADLETATLSDGTTVDRIAIIQMNYISPAGNSMGPLILQNLNVEIIDNSTAKKGSSEKLRLPLFGGFVKGYQSTPNTGLVMSGCKIKLKTASIMPNSGTGQPYVFQLQYSCLYIDGSFWQNNLYSGCFNLSDLLINTINMPSIFVKSTLCLDNFKLSSGSSIANVNTMVYSAILLRNFTANTMSSIVHCGSSSGWANNYFVLYNVNAPNLGTVITGVSDANLEGSHNLLAVTSHGDNHVREAYAESSILCYPEDIKSQTYLDSVNWPWTIDGTDSWHLDSKYMAGYPYIYEFVIPEDHDESGDIRAFRYGTKTPKYIYYGGYRVTQAYCNSKLVWDV